MIALRSRRPARGGVLASLLRVMAILGLSAAAAGIYIETRHADLNWIPDPDSDIRVDPTRLQAIAISADEVLARIQAELDGGEPVAIIDARSPESFAAGHIAAATIFNIPGDAAEAHLEKLELLRGSDSILYCNSLTCDLSEQLYNFMQELGFEDMRIYTEGWDGWEQTGYPTDDGPELFFGAPLDAGLGDDDQMYGEDDVDEEPTAERSDDADDGGGG